MVRQFIAADEGYKNSIRSYGNGMVRRVVTIATPYRGSEFASFASGVYSNIMSKFNDTIIFQSNSGNWTGAAISMIMKNMLNDLLKSTINISAQSLVDLSVDSAFLRKLWKKEQTLSSDVPMHAIYGLVKNDLGEVEIISKVTKGAGVIGSKILPSALPGMGRLMTLLIQTLIATGIEDITEQIIYQLFDSLYSGQDYDIAVPETSAHGDFADNATTRREGHQYEHNSSLAQKDNHDRVIELLLSNGEEFQPFKSKLTYTEEELNIKENILIVEGSNIRGNIRTNFISGIKITVDRNSVNVSGTTMQDIVVTATAIGDPIPSDSLYMLIETSQGIYKMVKVGTADGGKTFSVTLQFSEADVGVINITCFAAPKREIQNTSNTKALPQLNVKETTVEDKVVTLYVSEHPVQITVVPEIREDKIEELEFSNGFDTIFVNVGSEVSIPLYVKTIDGKHYNISGITRGISWSLGDSSIAEVTENGKLKGLKAGITSLTANFMGQNATINISVNGIIVDGVPIDEEHFPDETFRNELEDFDWNEDSYLNAEEIKAIKTLYVESDIYSLKGIEYLTALEKIEISSGIKFNTLQNDYYLDLSGFAALKHFRSYGKIDRLNLSGCSSLEEIYCPDNDIISLDISGCTAIVSLDCAGNFFSTLSLDCSTTLRKFNCSDTNLNTLDLSGFSRLTSFDCSGTGLGVGGMALVRILDISGCTSLTSENFAFKDNGYTSFIAEGCSALTSLKFHDSLLESLDVSDCSALKILDCYDNMKLTSIDLSGCLSLEYLNCSDNNLITLNVSNLPALKTLICFGYERKGKLKIMNASSCSSLKELRCNENDLISLDVSGCNSLEILDCSENNSLTTLDVGECLALKELYCNNFLGKLTNLNVKGCKALTILECNQNNISVLDLSGCSSLKELYCTENNLVMLDVSDCPVLTTLSCDVQYVSQAKLTHIVGNKYPYQFDLRVYISEDKIPNVVCEDSYSPTSEITEHYDNGFIMFSSKPTSTSYGYKVAYSRGAVIMDVLIIFADEVEEITLKPSITTSSLTSGKARTSYQDVKLEATGTQPITWSAAGLPSNLSLDSSTGVISGIPLKAGNYTVKITVTNEAGSDSKDFELVISAHPTNISITSQFSDENLRSYISDQFDANDDGYLSEEEIASVTKLDVHEKGISSLSGIENFTSLNELNCSGNSLTELQVASLDKLTILDCSSNNLISLDVSSCDQLIYLNCSSNKLEELNISGCVSLDYLDCSVNALPMLDISVCSKLTFLDCLSNQLTELDLSSCLFLKNLDCRDNKLTKLDISHCPKLYEAICDPEVTIIIEAANDPVITTDTLPNGTVGEEYPETTFEATGTQPIIWSWEGNYPTGLILAENGKITGKPEMTGTFNFTVKAKNEAGEISQSLSIIIKASEFSAQSPVITTTTLPSGKSDEEYHTTLEATGDSPITWSKGADWPNWLGLDSNTGILSGTPSVSGNYRLEVMASNSAGSVTKNFLIEIMKSNEQSNIDPSPSDDPNDKPSTDPVPNPNPTQPDTDDPVSHGDTNGGDNANTGYDTENSGGTTTAEDTPSAISTAPFSETTLVYEEIQNIIGDIWSGAPLCSVETDLDQTDNRTETEKTDLIKTLVNETDMDVAFAYALRSMKPTKTGVFTFTLTLPTEMKVGDLLIWRCQKSLSSASVASFLVSASDESEAIFIDTATKKETKVVPASRSVSVLTYLESNYVYEPVVMTTSNASSNEGEESKIDGNENHVPGSNSASGGGGGGCATGSLEILWMSLVLLAKKKLFR